MLPVVCPETAVKSVCSALRASATVEPRKLLEDGFTVAVYLKNQLLAHHEDVDPSQVAACPPATHLGIAESLESLLPGSPKAAGTINWAGVLATFLPILVDLLTNLVPVAIPAAAPWSTGAPVAKKSVDVPPWGVPGNGTLAAAPAPPANVLTDLNNLAAALATVQTDTDAVAAAVMQLGGDQTAVDAANATLATDTTAANGLYTTLLTDLAAWDAGSTPPAQQFKKGVGKLLDKHKQEMEAKPKAFNWQGILTQLLPLILALISGLTPPTPTPTT